MAKKDVGWSAVIIDLKGKDDDVELEIYQNQSDEFVKQGQLVWSKDSQRVAYFEPDRKGGSTSVYFRNGSKFELVELPEIPECEVPAAKEGDEYVKDIENITRPVKWLPSGELVLAAQKTRMGESGATRSCGQTITIAFDANRKASIKSVKDEKAKRE